MKSLNFFVLCCSMFAGGQKQPFPRLFPQRWSPQKSYGLKYSVFLICCEARWKTIIASYVRMSECKALCSFLQQWCPICVVNILSTQLSEAIWYCKKRKLAWLLKISYWAPAPTMYSRQKRYQWMIREYRAQNISRSNKQTSVRMKMVQLQGSVVTTSKLRLSDWR